jgi:hypothetical protein
MLARKMGRRQNKDGCWVQRDQISSKRRPGSKTWVPLEGMEIELMCYDSRTYKLIYTVYYVGQTGDGRTALNGRLGYRITSINNMGCGEVITCMPNSTAQACLVPYSVKTVQLLRSGFVELVMVFFNLLILSIFPEKIHYLFRLQRFSVYDHRTVFQRLA